MTDPLKHACPKCGHVSVDWEKAPGLRDTLTFIVAAGDRGRTSQEIVKHFRVSLSNAGNRTAKLGAMGLVTYTANVNPKGGVIRTFRAASTDATGAAGDPSKASSSSSVETSNG